MHSLFLFNLKFSFFFMVGGGGGGCCAIVVELELIVKYNASFLYCIYINSAFPSCSAHVLQLHNVARIDYDGFCCHR